MFQVNVTYLHEGFKRKEFSPTEILEVCLARIEKLDKMFHSFITVHPELARVEAKASETRWMNDNTLSALDGIPVSFKDNLKTYGIRTTNGSSIDSNYVPDMDAEVVSRFGRLGALAIGKNNLHEYALGITSINPFYGTVRNPWSPRVMAGGSSGGSAVAISLGFASFAIGTDTSGSNRIPAACCGVVGMKPTFGLMSTAGVMPLSWTLDHVGPITSTVKDLSVVMQSYLNITHTERIGSFCDIRIGIPRSYFNENSHPEVLEVFYEVINKLSSLGASLVAVDLPYASQSIRVSRTIGTTEVGYVHRSRAETSLESYGEDVIQTFTKSKSTSAWEYFAAVDEAKKMTCLTNKLFQDVDVILTPTVPDVATEVGCTQIERSDGSEDISDSFVRFTNLFNITGHPAISVPGHRLVGGLPVGIQFVASKGDDMFLIQFAERYESEYLQDFKTQREYLLTHIYEEDDAHGKHER